MSYSSPSDGESEALMIRKLDDLVQRIIVQKSTPDWLPFISGSSFWVPPRRNNVKFVDLVGKLADQLSDEETLSLATDRGWPRSEFFINAGCPTNESMCCGSERLKPVLSSSPSSISFEESRLSNISMNHSTVETEDAFASLLELAANNDFEGFRRLIECDPSSVDETGLWYGRQKGSRQMVNEQRAPLMVAATYGSIDVIKLILSLSSADVNRPCGFFGCSIQ